MNRDDLPPTVPAAELPPDAPRGFMARFRNYFLTGLIVAGPIAITFYLTWWFVTWVDGLVRPFVPVGLSAGDLSAVRSAGLRAHRRGVRADAAGLPHRQPDRADAGRSRRETAGAHAGGARDLSRPQAGVRDAVLWAGIELPPGRPGRISLAGDVVDRADLAGAERRDRQQPARPGGAHFGVPALRAEPDHRVFLLCAQEQDHRNRDERRRCRDPDHVRRRGAARLRSAEADRRTRGLPMRRNGQRIAAAAVRRSDMAALPPPCARRGRRGRRGAWHIR